MYLLPHHVFLLRPKGNFSVGAYVTPFMWLSFLRAKSLGWVLHLSITLGENTNVGWTYSKLVPYPLHYHIHLHFQGLSCSDHNPERSKDVPNGGWERGGKKWEAQTGSFQVILFRILCSFPESINTIQNNVKMATSFSPLLPPHLRTIPVAI